MKQDAVPPSCQTRVYLLPFLGLVAAIWGLWSWLHALSDLSSCLERWQIVVGVILACRR